MRKPPLVRAGPQFTPHDAIETAIVALLADTNQKRAADAWLAVRNEVRQLILSGYESLWLVMSAQGSYTRLAKDTEDTATFAAAADGPVYVVHLTPAIEKARSRFAEENARHDRNAANDGAAVRRMGAR